MKIGKARRINTLRVGLLLGLHSGKLQPCPQIFDKAENDSH
jgi:hypothetical protein